jgi:glutathione-regulated potassium-efflux system protein KefB
LLGLFFLAVGMSIDLPVVLRDWQTLALGVLGLMLTKMLGIYLIARLTRSNHEESLYRATLLAQGGEFAFVLYSAATAAGIFDARLNAALTAIVIVSMALTPLGVLALRLLPKVRESMAGVDRAESLHGRVLIIGFGRFGQVVSQGLLARGVDVTIIDTDTDRIRSAANFGFKVYYGDGTRLDVLRACGAAEAEAIAICVEKPEATSKIVEIVKAEFPRVQALARAYDRQHALKLIAAGADYQIRETFESALSFSETALQRLGVAPVEAAQIATEVRRRDGARLELELASGLGAGKALIHGNVPKPTPFTQPTREAEALSDETAVVVGAAGTKARP